MNENIDLTKILKDCPKGFKLYSTIYGNVEFMHINTNSMYPVRFTITNERTNCVTSDGKDNYEFDGECTFFPSRDQRDWSKFTAPWYKKEKFDPKTLNPFDKVLVYDTDGRWRCNLFSHIRDISNMFPYATIGINYSRCIPYNGDTKHLVGTTKEAPEYYRYWEE